MVQLGNATELYVRSMLYRFDCPSTLTIGEYVLDLLEMPSRTAIARHVLDCALCEDELTVTRAFMATDLVLPSPGLWPTVRRVVASLLPRATQPAFAMTRGADPSSGEEYRAGSVK